MAHKIRICTYRREWCYHEHSTAFYANLYELLKEPSRVEQLAKEGYVVIDRYLERRFDRPLDLEFLEALQDYFLELESVRVNYTPQDIQILIGSSYISQRLPQSCWLKALLKCKQYSAPTRYPMRSLEPI